MFGILLKHKQKFYFGYMWSVKEMITPEISTLYLMFRHLLDLCHTVLRILIKPELLERIYLPYKQMHMSEFHPPEKFLLVLWLNQIKANAHPYDTDFPIRVCLWPTVSIRLNQIFSQGA